MQNGTYLSIAILLIAVVILVAYVIYLVKKDGWRKTAINLIVQIEERMGSGYGKQKMEMVVQAFRELLPTPLRVILTTEMIKGFIQAVFNEIKESLDYRGEQKNG